MQRLMICVLGCCLMSANVATAQDNPLKSMWPFNKMAKVTSPKRSNVESKMPSLPSPGKLIDAAQKRTDAVFAKTRSTWNGVKDLGNSLNPFSGAGGKAAKKSPSLLDRLLPKQPVSSTPATVGEFLQMKRP